MRKIEKSKKENPVQNESFDSYIQSVSLQYIALFLKKPASRKYLPLGVLILDWWCVLKAWAVNVFGMVNLIEPRFWLGGFFVLVNSIKFDQSGAAGGSRSDTHRGVNTFEKLAFPKIKRHIGMKPIVRMYLCHFRSILSTGSDSWSFSGIYFSVYIQTLVAVFG